MDGTGTGRCVADPTESAACDASSWCFGEWRLDAVQGLLTGLAGERRLEPKQLQLLLYFLRHPQRSIPVDELVDAVWSGVVVSDSAVHYAVSALRRALGEDPKLPRFLQTLPRRGYVWLVAPQAFKGAGSAPEPPGALGTPVSLAGEPPFRSRSERVSRRAAVALAVLLLSFLGGWYYWLTATTPPRSLVILPLRTENAAARDLAEALTAELTYALANQPALHIKVPGGGRLRADELPEVGEAARRFGVRAGIGGSLRREGAAWLLQIDLIDAGSGEFLASHRLRTRADDWRPLQEELLAALFKDLGLTPPAPVLPPTSALVNFHYLLGRRALGARSATSLGEAVQHFTAAVEADTRYWPAWSGLADAESLLLYYAPEQASADRAQAALHQAESLAPDAAMVWASRGILAFHTQHLDAARKALEQALLLAPGTPEAKMLLGRTLLLQSMNQLPEARVLFEQAVERDPLLGMAHVNLGLAKEFTGDLAGAEASFAQAASVEPGLASAQWGLAFVQAERGRHEAALDHFREALRLNPSLAPQIAPSLGSYLMRAGAWNEAEDWIQLATSLEPLSHDALHAVFFLRWLRTPDAARQGLPAALSASPIHAKEDLATLLAYQDALTGNCSAALTRFKALAALPEGYAGLWNLDDARMGMLAALPAIQCAREQQEFSLARQWLEQTKRWRAEHAREQFPGWLYLDASLALLDNNAARSVEAWRQAAASGWMSLDWWRLDPVWRSHQDWIPAEAIAALEQRRQNMLASYHREFSTSAPFTVVTAQTPVARMPIEGTGD